MSTEHQTSLPPPLTPENCDLRDFHRMMIDIPRLRSSTFDATIDDGAWRAGLNLWMSAWQAVPAAALDDNEAALCKAAGLNRDVRTWRKVREEAMRGWVLCNDHRWYHETVAEFALEAWIGKLIQRLVSAKGNAKRYGHVLDVSGFVAGLKDAADRLRALKSSSPAIQKAEQYIANNDPGGSLFGSLPEPDGSQGERGGLPNGSQEKGTGKEKEKGKEKQQAQLALGPDRPDWLPLEEWAAFVEMRKKQRKPLTPHAEKLAISQLSKLRDAGNDPAEVLNQSTMHCWQGLFAIKPEGHSGQANRFQKPAAQPDMRSPEQQQRDHIKLFKERGVWLSTRGPDPSNPDCNYPKHILAEFGYGQRRQHAG